jgi:hypothetical protein
LTGTQLKKALAPTASAKKLTEQVVASLKGKSDTVHKGRSPTPPLLRQAGRLLCVMRAFASA